MDFVSRYKAYKPDANGIVHYTEQEHAVWRTLFTRQSKLLPGRASDEFLQGLTKLRLTSDKVPQLSDVGEVLKQSTGWQLSPVEALITAREFFQLLAEKKFPVATFIRHPDELDYVKEPDIFHELFGHCPMLTNQVYADFVHDFGCKVLSFPESDWPLLQRIFWFTVEFGLIHTAKGMRAYGGGILSSISETAYSVESDIPMRVIFDPLVVCRVPYRIDQLQPVYFVIHDYQQLYDFISADISKIISKAHTLGEFPPFFLVDEGNPNIHIHAC